ncbi:hypothetical protein [Hymenobacter glacieicola]|uniref:WWE domain-containing protein n=1 Tax=Hymenobacter glacieicola TaxID=1562124 RepID=A0ABQ1WZI1_9BACT|nr:hypothetical protein [Hymenobacter glacieicola]GGG52516.1 hypothetical protein GCM10011378_30920 [Hymenobacter glacieicola]
MSFIKRVALLIMLGCATSVAQAQLLPVPNSRNPDWVLEKAAVPKPDASVLPLITDRMPNAAQKSISSSGNRHYCWDAQQQLAYEWVSQPGRVAPDQRVTVREERTGTAYTYRRRAK